MIESTNFAQRRVEHLEQHNCGADAPTASNMRDIRIAAAQFEHRDGDKTFNLAQIDALARRAAAGGAEIACFHECCITGYTFLQSLCRQELAAIAEPVPTGPSCAALQEIAARHRIVVLAGLIEATADGHLFNTFVCVTPEAGVIAKHRKLHAFVNPHLSSGDSIRVFDLLGCKCAILICYDNNLPENPRLAALQGAEIIIAPHVTGCSASAMPGRGLVDPSLWARRAEDPVPLRLELSGPKGRGWLMRWLPSRAWENGVHYIFANPIGLDGGEVRNGNAMVLDPYGEVVSECHALDADVCIAYCSAAKLDLAGGRRYLRARRPSLYWPFVEEGKQAPKTLPGWQRKAPPDAGQVHTTISVGDDESGGRKGSSGGADDVTDAVAAADPRVLQAAQTLYDYMRMCDEAPLAPADAILVLGSNDVRVAHCAAALHAGGLAPLVVFSEKQGRATEWLGSRTEAEWLASAAEERGLPASAILREPRATNTGENIRFCRELLARR